MREKGRDHLDVTVEVLTWEGSRGLGAPRVCRPYLRIAVLVLLDYRL